MLDLKTLENEPLAVREALAKRGDVPGLDAVFELIKRRKELIQRVQVEQTKRNELNKGMKGASKEEIDEKRAEMKQLSALVKALEGEQKDAAEKLDALLAGIPNMPLDDVPEGKDEEDNRELKKVLEPKTFSFTPKDHVDLGTNLGIVDFERGAKVAGSRFAFMRGAGAKLERALAQFMLDFHIDKGDTELSAPLMVLPSAMFGTGQLPKFEEDLFKVPRKEGEDPLYLIPTAEVPVTNYYADEILEEETLPQRFCAFTPCFRAEAGAAGRDTRGLIRLHQFPKVEMVRFCTEEQAEAELEDLVDRASKILAALELPHRTVLLCTGDMSASAQKTIDLEVWLPAQDTYREISSCSRFGTYQARRAKIRYRPAQEGNKKAKPRPLHTLNGSGLAVGRTLVAILENHQQEDGSIAVPDALRPYLGGISKIN